MPVDNLHFKRITKLTNRSMTWNSSPGRVAWLRNRNASCVNYCHHLRRNRYVNLHNRYNYCYMSKSIKIWLSCQYTLLIFSPLFSILLCFSLFLPSYDEYSTKILIFRETVQLDEVCRWHCIAAVQRSRHTRSQRFDLTSSAAAAVKFLLVIK